MYIFMYVYTHTHIYVYTYRHTNIHIHTHKHTYISTYIHTHIYFHLKGNKKKLEYKISNRVIREAITMVCSCDTNCQNRDIVENMGINILKFTQQFSWMQKMTKRNERSAKTKKERHSEERRACSFLW